MSSADQEDGMAEVETEGGAGRTASEDETSRAETARPGAVPPVRSGAPARDAAARGSESGSEITRARIHEVERLIRAHVRLTPAVEVSAADFGLSGPPV